MFNKALPFLCLFLIQHTISQKGELIYRSPPITEDGKVLGIVSVYDTEEPADIIFDFIRNNKLGDHVKQGLLDHACSTTTCTRREAILYNEKIVDLNDQLMGELVINEGESPATVINQFSRRLKLPYDSSSQLLTTACESSRITCDLSVEKLEMYAMVVPVDGVDRGTVVILEGQEPADIIHSFCSDKDLPDHIQKAIIVDACSRNHITCTRDYPLLFSSGPIMIDDQIVGEINIKPNDGEPIDIISQFCKVNNLNINIRTSIYNAACKNVRLNCTRDIPTIYTNTINVDGVDLGKFVVLEGQEPVDAVFQFYKLKHRLGPSIRRNLLKDICSKKDITCTRDRAILYDSGSINLDGKLLRSFIVYEHEQPADVAYIYSRETTPTLPRNVEAQLIARACETIDINCTRQRALLVERTVPVPGNCSIYQQEDENQKENENENKNKNKNENQTIDKKVDFATSLNGTITNITNATELARIATEMQAAAKALAFATKDDSIWDEPCKSCISAHIEKLFILEGTEPIDQISIFQTLHNITSTAMRNAILISICNGKEATSGKVVCTRDRPLLFETNIAHGVNNELSSKLIILENDLPSNILYQFVSKHGMDINVIDILMKQICAPPLGNGPLKTCGNTTSRYQNIVLEQPIRIDNDTLPAPLIIRDDQREPADVIDEYSIKYNITSEMRNNIIEKVCSSNAVVCSRTLPVIYRWPFINFTTGEVYGEVEILQNQMVVDVIHLYLLELNSPFINQTQLEPIVVERACISILKRYSFVENEFNPCSRKVALYYENTIMLDNIQPKETIKIWGNGIEPVDQIYQYCRKNQLNRDMQTQILNDACRPDIYPGIRCTRGDALVYEETVSVGVLCNVTYIWNACTNTTEQGPKVSDVLPVYSDSDVDKKYKEAWFESNNVSEIVVMVPRTIEIYQGKQVADVMETFRWQYNYTMNHTVRNEYILKICNHPKISTSWNTKCIRTTPHLIEQPLNMPPKFGGHYVGMLHILEPPLYEGELNKGIEPADQILQFTMQADLQPSIRRNLIHNICLERKEMFDQVTNTSLCKRTKSLLFNQSILLPGENNNEPIGPIVLWGDVEPCDQIDAWTYEHGYSKSVRDQLIKGICALPTIPRLECTRQVVSHWSVNVESQNVQFLENTEATDLLYRAFKATGQMQHKRYMVLDVACSQPRMNCQRLNKGLLGSLSIGVNSTYNENVWLWEIGMMHDEVIDMIYQFGMKHGMNYRTRWQLSRRLCATFYQRCTRSRAAVAWIPVNRDNNITCPRAKLDHRPYDGKDLLQLFFESHAEWVKEKQTLMDEWIKKSQAKSNKDRRKRNSRKSGQKKEVPSVPITVSVYKWMKKYIYFNLNRTTIFEGSIHANESFPIEWLVVDFDKHVAIPYMLLLGWLPFIMMVLVCGLKFRTVPTGNSGSGDDDDDEDDDDDVKPKKGKKKKEKKKRKKILVKKVIEKHHRGGRVRTKTPIRVTENAVINGDDSNGSDSDSGDNTSWFVRFKRCCCCSCNLTKYICRRWICRLKRCQKCKHGCDRCVIRPSVISILFMVVMCSGHYYLVQHVYTNILRGFFILSPHKESALYFDQNGGNYMGDIVVLEGDTPIDALYEFASIFGTYGETYLNTPILRTQRYWDLFHQLCGENPHLDCSQTIPREEMLEGISVNQHGYKLSVSYKRPVRQSDCLNVSLTNEETGGYGAIDTTSCVIESADNFCELLDPSPPDCRGMIVEQVIKGLKTYEEVLRWNGKQQYRAVELTRDVSNQTIRETVNRLTYEFAVPCFKGPHAFGQGNAAKKIGKLSQTLHMTDDPAERDFYDQPCRVIFGAMCARTKPSGDMLIETMD